MSDRPETSKQREGRKAETLAAKHLKAQGAKIIERNYLCRLGEVDIIAELDEYLLFVEVKYRSRQDFGGAAYAVPASKQKKIIRAALSYMAERSHRTHARFDVVLIDNENIQWIANAFDGSAYED